MGEPRKFIPLRPAADSALAFADAGGACTEAEPFALMVKGNSMEPEFSDGHIIMVDPSMPPVNACYVVAETEDEYIFRQLQIRDGSKYLVPLNDLYPSLALEHDRAIVGVITQRSGHRRHETKKYC